MKRFITILLTCCIVMYMLPLSVFALEAAEPIEISSCEDFNNIRNNLNGDYILAQNLDFSTWGNWEPIGQKEVPFTGTFDGNGYVISNLTIEQDKNSAENEADYFASVFGYVSGGEIINLGINNTSIKLNYDGSYYSDEEEILANAGGIVGLIKDGTISNCFFTGDVVVLATGNAFARAGGIAAAGINSTISNCYSNAQIYATAEYANTMVAGIVAWLDGTNVSNCYAAGTVEGLNENGYCYAGGIHSSANTSSIWGIIISYGGTVRNCAVLLNEIKADGTTNIVEDIGYASEQYNNIRIASNSAEAWEQSTYESLGWDFDSIWYMQNKQYPLLFIFNGNFNLDPNHNGIFAFRAASDTIDVSANYTYSDQYFDRNCQTYDHDLAKMSIRLALAAFNSSENGESEDNSAYTKRVTVNYDGGTISDVPVKAKNIVKLLAECGFANITPSDSYSQKPTQDSIGVCIASKEIDDDNTLIAVAIRGGGYEDEWAGNFEIYTDNDSAHAGFLIAALKVEAAILEFMIENGITRENTNLKFWVTGYSRAGATANLVSSMLYDDGIASDENIFAYTFEAPQPKQAEVMIGYDFIHNIVNPIDIVPKVVMSDWGYKRYGNDYFIPSPATTYDYYESYKEVLNNYNYYLRRGNGSLVEYLPELLFADINQEVWLDYLMSMLADALERPNSDLTLELSGVVREVILDDLSIAEIIYEVFKHPIISTALGGAFLAYLANKDDCNDLASTLYSGHHPELTMAWLDSIDAFGLDQDAAYRLIKVNCPVDISVYDSNTRLVAQVIDDVVQSIDGISINAYIDDDGQKVFVLPGDETFNIELTATDDGEMTYSVYQYDYSHLSFTKAATFHDVTLRNGGTFTGVVEECITLTTPEYSLTDNTTSEKLIPEFLENDEIEYHNIEVQAVGNGYVEGTDYKLKGEYIQIEAYPNEGETFLGWYLNDELVSTESAYRFMVTQSQVFVAKFSETSSGVPSYTITFDANGGFTTQTTVTANSDGRVSILPNAVRDGYMFDGWYTDPVNGTKVTTSTVFTSNTTVYAHWTIESSTYTVTYTDGVDGEEVFTDQTFNVEKGSATPAFIGTPTRSGYTFTGWNPAVSATVTDNQVYTATWVADAPIKYAVTVNGSYTSITGAGEYETGAAVTISAGTRSGYTFAGWTSSDVNITNKYSNTTTFTMPATDVTVTANWTKDSAGGVIIPTEFSINIKDSDNGKVEASVKYAVPGSTVKLTVTPDEGYELDTLSVKSDRKEIDVTEKNGKYQFTMPYGSVNVTATFKAVNPYNDVDTDDWFYDDVLLVTAKELMEGTGNSKFSPDISADRAMIVTILWRQEGCPVVDSPVDFDDVADGLWYSEAIDWASSNGIVNGYGDGNYGPTNQITREQIMAILNRYAVYKNWTDDIALPMIPQYNCSTWAENNVIWADMSGLLNGLGVDITDMTAKASRAELAAYLSRFVQNVVK